MRALMFGNSHPGCLQTGIAAGARLKLLRCRGQKKQKPQHPGFDVNVWLAGGCGCRVVEG